MNNNYMNNNNMNFDYNNNDYNNSNDSNYDNGMHTKQQSEWELPKQNDIDSKNKNMSMITAPRNARVNKRDTKMASSVNGMSNAPQMNSNVNSTSTDRKEGEPEGQADEDIQRLPYIQASQATSWQIKNEEKTQMVKKVKYDKKSGLVKVTTQDESPQRKKQSSNSHTQGGTKLPPYVTFKK